MALQFNMVRIHRRTHSVSGPPSVDCLMKDVACCCNRGKIHDFYKSMMAMRRNPQRGCKKEEIPILTPTNPAPVREINQKPSSQRICPEGSQNLQLITRHKACSSNEPFRFFKLPREVRDHVYAYLVVRRGRREPIIEARAILRDQKKRVTAERTRVRLNQKRILNGRCPITPRDVTIEPILSLNVIGASRVLQYEASDYMYENNWFAISLDNFPAVTIDAPIGWDYNRITRMQLEIQLKDAQRMNSYIDWATFFSAFPSLRFLRIIPTFHPKYVAWAQMELNDWNTAHFIHRAFFRELLANIPERLALKLGASLNPKDDMQLEGRITVSKRVLRDMYLELGTRRNVDLYRGGFGAVLSFDRIIDLKAVVVQV